MALAHFWKQTLEQSTSMQNQSQRIHEAVSNDINCTLHSSSPTLLGSQKMVSVLGQEMKHHCGTSLQKERRNWWKIKFIFTKTDVVGSSVSKEQAASNQTIIMGHFSASNQIQENRTHQSTKQSRKMKENDEETWNRKLKKWKNKETTYHIWHSPTWSVFWHARAQGMLEKYFTRKWIKYGLFQLDEWAREHRNKSERWKSHKSKMKGGKKAKRASSRKDVKSQGKSKTKQMHAKPGKNKGGFVARQNKIGKKNLDNRRELTCWKIVQSVTNFDIRMQTTWLSNMHTCKNIFIMGQFDSFN